MVELWRKQLEQQVPCDECKCRPINFTVQGWSSSFCSEDCAVRAELRRLVEASVHPPTKCHCSPDRPICAGQYCRPQQPFPRAAQTGFMQLQLLLGKPVAPKA